MSSSSPHFRGGPLKLPCLSGEVKRRPTLPVAHSSFLCLSGGDQGLQHLYLSMSIAIPTGGPLKLPLLEWRKDQAPNTPGGPLKLPLLEWGKIKPPNTPGGPLKLPLLEWGGMNLFVRDRFSATLHLSLSTDQRYDFAPNPSCPHRLPRSLPTDSSCCEFVILKVDGIATLRGALALFQPWIARKGHPGTWRFKSIL